MIDSHEHQFFHVDGDVGIIHDLDDFHAPVKLFFYLFKGFVVAGQADGHPGNGFIFRHADGQAV